jgi:hypothetical protein
MRDRLLALVCSLSFTAVACGGAASSSDGAAPGGKCGADVEAGQACNALANVATPITPTCMTGTMPTGTGGTIVDGTYVLTSQTYYNLSTCPTEPLTATIAITGGCLQLVSAGVLPGTASATFVTSMNEITLTVTCDDQGSGDGGAPRADAPLESFTASGNTLSLFTRNLAAGNPNPDRIQVFTKH